MRLYYDYGRELGFSQPRILLSSLAAGNIRDNPAARKHLLQELSIPEKDFHLAHQCHSRTVIHISEHGRDPEQFCDGIFLREGEGAAAVTVADCVPLFLFAAGGGIAAVLHSGWKGTGILETAVKSIQSSYGTAAEKLTLVIGPSIRKCCYQVDSERARHFAETWGDECIRNSGDEYYLDLVQANRGLAVSLGINQVRVIDQCTVCGSGFGSFRRQGEGFTKMAAITGFF